MKPTLGPILSLRWGALALILVTSALVLFFKSRGEKPPSLSEDPPGIQKDWTALVNTDGPEVFRRAFWRHPSDGDRIANAERTEWVDPRGAIRRWQWFIELEPSPALEQWLADEGSFRLTPADSVDTSSFRVPNWFAAAKAEQSWQILRSGDLTVLRSAGNSRLLACAGGFGFSAPARQP